ncbi:YqaA family protein [Neptuniibacter sp. CAU 1671]|uniref:YqaA family protein n=1 Tax=Neptuniibacter sp. CAU 1671 TaxID=3032593 RepID=UPI0023DAFFE2|nr:YqaA family protein [Neptuniibacter sp. CAU 1671]MDF2181149.1 DedA family protein [Neptuniibacter sp. CAU 1671]
MNYFLMFVSALGAGSLLPFYSEVALIAFLPESNATLLWLSATIGNTAGAAINWWIGRYLTHYESRRWFPFKPDKLHRAQHWFQRYGAWSLLLAWLPIGGDALTFIAGVMRVRLDLFLLLTFIGKGLRYLVVIAIFFNLL